MWILWNFSFLCDDLGALVIFFSQKHSRYLHPSIGLKNIRRQVKYQSHDEGRTNNEISSDFEAPSTPLLSTLLQFYSSTTEIGGTCLINGSIMPRPQHLPAIDSRQGEGGMVSCASAFNISNTYRSQLCGAWEVGGE